MGTSSRVHTPGCRSGRVALVTAHHAAVASHDASATPVVQATRSGRVTGHSRCPAPGLVHDARCLGIARVPDDGVHTNLDPARRPRWQYQWGVSGLSRSPIKCLFGGCHTGQSFTATRPSIAIAVLSRRRRTCTAVSTSPVRRAGLDYGGIATGWTR